MTVGEKIAKIRKENNLTQEQFAEIMKVSRQSVSKWELNTVYPDTEKLIRISKLFNCSMDYLLKDEIDNIDENLLAESERTRLQKVRASVLTYLSFPPIFGWIIGIVSIRLQFTTMKNRRQIVLSIIGMIFSIILTVFMLVGIIFEL